MYRERKMTFDIAGFDLDWLDPKYHNLMNELVGLEAVSIDDEKDGIRWKFKPYPMSILGAMLNALNLPPETDYLEVGCGVGAKLVMAEKLFGYTVRGIDYYDAYVQISNELLSVHNCIGYAFCADAVSFNGYDEYDIIWLNKPLAPWTEEQALETRVQLMMKPGAYLILGNGITKPDWPVQATATAAVIYRKPK
jgi:SAM-dependent methyltransferase